jgi:virulence family protein
MLWFNRNKKQERYYLLAGMGGRSYQRKQNFILKLALVAGLVVSVTLAVVLYFMNRAGK